jgi:hypothetical protein
MTLGIFLFDFFARFSSSGLDLASQQVEQQIRLLVSCRLQRDIFLFLDAVILRLALGCNPQCRNLRSFHLKLFS